MGVGESGAWARTAPRGGVLGALTICAGSSSTAMTESRRGHLRTGEQVAWTRDSDMATSSSALRNDTIRAASRACASTPIATASACVRATRIFKLGAAWAGPSCPRSPLR